MKIEYSHDLSAADYNRLRHSAGWADLTLEQAETGLSNSAYIISARREGEVVGMARYLSDGGYIRFIADVVVLPEYQGLGIGRYMVAVSYTHLHSNCDSGNDNGSRPFGGRSQQLSLYLL